MNGKGRNMFDNCSKTVLIITFPNFDNPLCSGIPPGLSTFEQSALKKKFFFLNFKNMKPTFFTLRNPLQVDIYEQMPQA